MVATSDDLLASLLTPVGRGAIATVGLRGAAAEQVVLHYFRPRHGRLTARLPMARIVVGLWRRAAPAPECSRFGEHPSALDVTAALDTGVSGRGTWESAGSDQVGEEVVVCRVDRSTIEIHCHGGEAASRAVLNDLAALGVREVAWRQWLVGTEPAGLVEVRGLLAQTESTRTASVVLDQWRGAWLARIEEIRTMLAGRELASARAAVERLRALIPVGQHLIEPWRVALLGPPNVGKSSLMNALVGYSRSIVLDEPGTTRDIVATRTMIDGWPIEVYDMAGLRTSDDPVEREGARRAVERAQASDLIVAVAEPDRVDWSFVDGILGVNSPRSAMLRVLNKIDLVMPQGCVDLESLVVGSDRGEVMAVSALTGERIDVLALAIVRALVRVEPMAGEAVPVLARHAAWIADAAERLERGTTEGLDDLLTLCIADCRP